MYITHCDKHGEIVLNNISFAMMWYQQGYILYIFRFECNKLRQYFLYSLCTSEIRVLLKVRPMDYFSSNI